MTKAQQREQAEALDKLREWIKPGDTVYTVLRHVSRSGMQREIGVILPYVTDDGRIDHLYPNHAVATALGMRLGKHDGIVIGGCGMDMGFQLVYLLSHALYGDGYPCLGKGKCPSCYHSNHRDRLRCEGVTRDGQRLYCYRPDRWNTRFPVPEDWPTGEPHDIGEGQTIPGPLLACVRTVEEHGAYEVCPTCHGAGDVPNPGGPERFDLVHTDGYALRHRWL